MRLQAMPSSNVQCLGTWYTDNEVRRGERDPATGYRAAGHVQQIWGEQLGKGATTMIRYRRRLLPDGMP